jgi:adenylate cyclase class IV
MDQGGDLAMKVALRREAKYFCNDFPAVRIILAELGAEYVAVKKQTDTIFTRYDSSGRTTSGRIKARTEEDGRCLVYVYDRSSNESTVEFEYYEFRDEQIVSMLQSLFGEPVIVVKEREIWTLHHLIFHLDTVEEIGTLFEVEAIGHTDMVDWNACMDRIQPYLTGKIEGSNEDLVRAGRVEYDDGDASRRA